MFVEDTLNLFGKRVIQQSRTNLTKKDKNASKSLYNSLKYDLKVSNNKYEVSFSMEDYGNFIDRGVKGVGGTKADGSKWETKKVTNNDFKYSNKRPPAKAFDKWVVRRGLASRDKKGRFVDRNSVKFAIANSVYHTGLETTDFFTIPLEQAFNKLPDDLLKNFLDDIDF